MALHRTRSEPGAGPALRAAVGPARPDTAGQSRRTTSAGCDADGTAGDRAGGGKAVRPALALLSAEAAGAPAEVGVPGAVAVELVHNFSLLHDDLMDGDLERRHRPTVWSLWGAPTAILTGDAMLTLAQRGAAGVAGSPARPGHPAAGRGRPAS